MPLAALTPGATAHLLSGDTVHVVATVVRVHPLGLGVDVELVSPTNPIGYQVRVRDDGVVAVDIPEPPTEPRDGTVLRGPGPDSVNVFIRCDTDAATDHVQRRWPRRWRDVATGERIDWPTAHHRGADPTNPAAWRHDPQPQPGRT